AMHARCGGIRQGIQHLESVWCTTKCATGSRCPRFTSNRISHQGVILMNRIFSLVWNRAKKQVEVASELATNRSGSACSAGTGSMRRALLASCVVLAIGAAPLAALAGQTDCTGAAAPGTNALACGNSAYALGAYSVALGYQAAVNTLDGNVDGGMAFGDRAWVGSIGGDDHNGIAIGSYAAVGGSRFNGNATSSYVSIPTTNTNYSLALGAYAAATGANSVALGANSIVSAADSVSLGHSAGEVNPATGVPYASDLNRTISHVAAGTADTDAVNVGQLDAAIDDVTPHYVSINDGGVQGGNYNNNGATGLDAMAAGVAASAAGNSSIAAGDSAHAYTTG